MKCIRAEKNNARAQRVNACLLLILLPLLQQMKQFHKAAGCTVTLQHKSAPSSLDQHHLQESWWFRSCLQQCVGYFTSILLNIKMLNNSICLAPKGDRAEAQSSQSYISHVVLLVLHIVITNPCSPGLHPDKTAGNENLRFAHSA